MPVGVEAKIQTDCFMWFWNKYPEERRMLFHVDNNSWNEVIGAQKKALGVCAGVSDFIYIYWGKVYFLECKKPGGAQSEYQREFMRKCQDRGHIYNIFESLVEFQKIIKTIRNEQ